MTGKWLNYVAIACQETRTVAVKLMIDTEPNVRCGVCIVKDRLSRCSYGVGTDFKLLSFTHYLHRPRIQV